MRNVTVPGFSGSGAFWFGTSLKPCVDPGIGMIHDRRPAAYGYTVSVNGTEVYFRTCRELGAGPSYFFMEVPLVHQGFQVLEMVQTVVCGSGASDHTACRPITVNGMRALAAYEQAKVLSNG